MKPEKKILALYILKIAKFFHSDVFNITMNYSYF